MSRKPPKSTKINTGDGASIGRNVRAGGNFVGRDNITNYHVYSNKRRIPWEPIWAALIVTIWIVAALVTRTFPFQQRANNLNVPKPSVINTQADGSPVSTLSPTNTRAPDPEIIGVLIGELDDKYTLEIAVDNPTDNHLFINGITIEEAFYSDVQCAATPSPDYEIKLDEITITGSDKDSIKFDTTVEQLNPGRLNGYAFPARGEYGSFCAGYHISINLDTGFSLERDKLATFFITLPNKFKLTRNGEAYFQPILAKKSAEYSLSHTLRLELQVHDSTALAYTVELLKK